LVGLVALAPFQERLGVPCPPLGGRAGSFQGLRRRLGLPLALAKRGECVAEGRVRVVVRMAPQCARRLSSRAPRNCSGWPLPLPRRGGDSAHGSSDVAVLGRLAAATGGRREGHAVFFAFLRRLGSSSSWHRPARAQADRRVPIMWARSGFVAGVWLAIGVTACSRSCSRRLVRQFPRIGAPDRPRTPGASWLIRRLASLPHLRVLRQSDPICRPTAGRGRCPPPLVAMVGRRISRTCGDTCSSSAAMTLPHGGPLAADPSRHVAGAALVTRFARSCTGVSCWCPCGRWRRAFPACRYRWKPVADVEHAFRLFSHRLAACGRMYGSSRWSPYSRRVDAQLAAHQVAISLASFTFTVALVVATAAAVRCGGSNRQARRERDAHVGTCRLSGGVLVIGGERLVVRARFRWSDCPARHRSGSVLQAGPPFPLLARRPRCLPISRDGIQPSGRRAARRGDTKYPSTANRSATGASVCRSPCLLGFPPP